MPRTSEYIPPKYTAQLKLELPEMARFLAEHPTDSAADQEAFRVWRTNKTEVLLQTPEYSGLIVPNDEERSPAAITKKMNKWFLNQKTHPNIAFRELMREATEAVAATSTPGPTMSQSLSTSPASRSAGFDPIHHSLELAQRSFLLLLGEYSPRQCFMTAAKELIQRKVDEIRPTTPKTITGAALWNAAAAQIWNAEDFDRTPYEEMANDVATNVARNREMFPYIVEGALADIARRGLLGDLAMKVCVAFRDDNGHVNAHIAHVGYDSVSKTDIDITTDDTNAQVEGWMKEADLVLPRRLKQPSFTIPSNDDGVPVWPSIDVAGSPATQIEHVNNAFLQAHWDHRNRNVTAGSSKIPLAEIMADINKYIDVGTLGTPPTLIPSTPVDIMMLALYFAKLSKTATPFSFRAPDPPSEPLHMDVEATDSVSTSPEQTSAAQFILGILSRIDQSPAPSVEKPAPTSPTLKQHSIPSTPPQEPHNNVASGLNLDDSTVEPQSISSVENRPPEETPVQDDSVATPSNQKTPKPTSFENPPETTPLTDLSAQPPKRRGGRAGRRGRCKTKMLVLSLFSPYPCNPMGFV